MCRYENENIREGLVQSETFSFLSNYFKYTIRSSLIHLLNSHIHARADYLKLFHIFISPHLHIIQCFSIPPNFSFSLSSYSRVTGLCLPKDTDCKTHLFLLPVIFSMPGGTGDFYC